MMIIHPSGQGNNSHHTTTYHYHKMSKIMQTLVLAAIVICAVNSYSLEKAYARQDDDNTPKDFNYRVREYATHLAGEFAGELLGERIDDFVEKAVGSVLGIPHEDDSDPLLGDGSELGEAIAEALADGK